MVMTNSQICKDLLFINLNKCNVLVQRNSQRTTAIRASMKIYIKLKPSSQVVREVQSESANTSNILTNYNLIV